MLVNINRFKDVEEKKRSYNIILKNDNNIYKITTTINKILKSNKGKAL